MKRLIQRLIRKIYWLRFQYYFSRNKDSPMVRNLSDTLKYNIWNDEISFKIYSCGAFEEGNKLLWKNLINRDMVVFDIGANAGIYSMIAAEILSGSGMVHSFEPSELERNKFKKNFELNNTIDDSNVCLVDSAVGSVTGHTTFYLPMEFKGAYGSLQQPDIQETVRKITVPITTIGDYCYRSDVAKIDLLKIDVEGNELEVLQGADQELRKFRPCILLEVSDRRTSAFNYRAREICDLLLQRDYCLFTISKTSNSDNVFLRRYFVPEYIDYEDIFAVHKQNLSRFKSEVNIIFEE